MLLNRESASSRWQFRPDGTGKVTGDMPYMTDLSYPGMLVAKVLRSEHPHAWILSIHTDRALKLPGVRAVITYRDVPGMNRFGIIMPDQPVLCEDRVRYLGDAIAAVAADSEDIAEQALRLIEVSYEVLPVIDSPEAALFDGAPKLHPQGNLLYRASYRSGTPEEAFHNCAAVVDETYETPRQMHGYMETEGGVIVPEEDGGLSVYVGTQHGYKDRMQLARILAMPEEKIRIISSPMGGSFGGKDELNVQPYGALLALQTGCPVKIHNSRWESVRAGLKKHPMKIKMKTGTDQDGYLVAHQVEIVADTGAYATLGPDVLDFAVEHAKGPYRIPHVDVQGLLVHTNNGVSGEFRGFGGNQVTFAVEGQMDRLATLLHMDPWEIRKLNVRSKLDEGPLGQRIVPTNGMLDVMNELEQSDLWKEMKEKQAANLAASSPFSWQRTGYAAAITMHGGGLGFGRPDSSGGRLILHKDGNIEIAFGFEECGQGLLGTIQMIVTEQLGCAAEDIRIIIGDTARVPYSGSSTASRGTSMVWQAIKNMKAPWTRKMIDQASAISGLDQGKLRLGPGGIWRKELGKEELVVSYARLAEQAAVLPAETTHFHFPTTPDAVSGGHYLYSFAAVLAKVEVDLRTGRAVVKQMDHAVAAGPVINPMGYLGQIEGGAIMALGFALTEDILMEQGQYVNRNFDTYMIPTIADIPPIMNVYAVEKLEEGDVHGPRGVGEIGTVAVAPAIAAAVFDAVRVRIAGVPISPEELIGSCPQLMNKGVIHDGAL
jgi:xanthine dehydrogenase D subunit